MRYVVSLRAESGEYSLFVEVFADRIVDEGRGLKEKLYLKHTDRVDEAKLFTLREATEALRQIGTMGREGRIEEVSDCGPIIKAVDRQR